MVLGIYGAGGLGQEFMQTAQEINAETSCWEELVFVDDTPEKTGTTLMGALVLSFEQVMEQWGVGGIEFLIGVGEPAVKDKILKKLTDAGCEVTILVHPTSKYKTAAYLGKGVVIQNYSSTSPGVRCGNNVLIQGHVAMGHGITFEDNVVVSSFAFVGGETTVGRNTYIGPHSCIRNGLKIGSDVIVGMGSVVTKDIPDNVVVYGNPAKIVRTNDSKRVFK